MDRPDKIEPVVIQINLSNHRWLLKYIQFAFILAKLLNFIFQRRTEKYPILANSSRRYLNVLQRWQC